MKRLCQFILVMIFTLVLVGCGDFNQNQNCEHTYENGVCLKCGLEEEIPYEYNKTKFDGKNMQINKKNTLSGILLSTFFDSCSSCR